VKIEAPAEAKSDQAREKGADGVPDKESLALLPTKMTSVVSATPADFMAESPMETAPRALFGGRPARAMAMAATAAADISDEALVSAIRRGDRELGRQIYKRLIRVIESTLTRVLGRGERDHNDLIQAVFEEVVRTIHSGQFQMRCSLTSWAATIACHVGLNTIRSRRMERTVFDRDQALDAIGDDAAAGSHPEQALDARDDLRRLRVALAAMPEGRAEAVVMHDVLGYGLSEIAALSGSSVAAVQSRLVRGRRELAARLAISPGAREEEP
jgi:RNA polymerase sigma-70 factor (ECF subfamily)